MLTLGFFYIYYSLYVRKRNQFDMFICWFVALFCSSSLRLKANGADVSSQRICSGTALTNLMGKSIDHHKNGASFSVVIVTSMTSEKRKRVSCPPRPMMPSPSSMTSHCDTKERCEETM